MMRNYMNVFDDTNGDVDNKRFQRVRHEMQRVGIGDEKSNWIWSEWFYTGKLN